MNPTNKPVVIELQGRKLKLYFDLNTFCAFERVRKEETGQDRFFFDFLASLDDALKASRDKDGNSNPMALIRRVSVEDLRAFLWAACHEYVDKQAVWPMTLEEIGSLIDIASLPALVPRLMSASADNMPGIEEMPAVSRPPAPAPSAENGGGPAFGPSDEDVLHLVTTS